LLCASPIYELKEKLLRGALSSFNSQLRCFPRHFNSQLRCVMVILAFFVADCSVIVSQMPQPILGLVTLLALFLSLPYHCPIIAHGKGIGWAIIGVCFQGGH